MRRTIERAVACAVISGIILSLPACAQETSEWKLDASHSKAGFSVKHMMISNVRGEFSDVKGTAQYDGKNIKTIKVNAVINAGSINTGNEDRDKHLRGKDFFDVEKFPEIKFVSSKVKPAGSGKFKLVGDLTMHGVTKEVALDVEGPSQEINDKHGNIKVGASASTRVKRKDFGIQYGGLMDNGGAMIGDDVDITLDIEMAKPTSEKKADASK
jgi:polyisoprenoid-binding protein YceI